MSNSFFKFKQFTVYHDKCAMKVGTDGVLLGGWTNIADARSILDVGTGTGLIALMLSQRCSHSLPIDAIDIDADAITQAKENITNARFENIGCFHISLSDYAVQTDKGYDLIVSNPPYFLSSLHSPDRQRTVARHTDSLPVIEFIRFSVSLLNKDGGRISMIFPYQDKDLLIRLANDNGLYVSRVTNVRPTPCSLYKRVLFEFSNVFSECVEDDILIEESRHVYSARFRSLLSDFYLKF